MTSILVDSDTGIRRTVGKTIGELPRRDKGGCESSTSGYLE
jgi:hypothetical protein